MWAVEWTTWKGKTFLRLFDERGEAEELVSGLLARGYKVECWDLLEKVTQ